MISSHTFLRLVLNCNFQNSFFLYEIFWCEVKQCYINRNGDRELKHLRD